MGYSQNMGFVPTKAPGVAMASREVVVPRVPSKRSFLRRGYVEQLMWVW